MQEKTTKLLNQIGINEDYLTYFESSYIKEIIIDKQSNKFHFIINTKNILPINVYDDLLNCLKETFSHEINFTIDYDGTDYNNCFEYLNRLMTKYAEESVRYNVFVNREIKVIDNLVEYPIYNKIDELYL